MAKEDNIAIISTGGKQYRVQAGDKISVELLEAKAGTEVTFSDVLLLQDGDQIKVGTPTVSGVTVTGKVLEVAKDDKVIVFRKKRRKGFKRIRGHRQQKMLVEIESIGGKKAPAKAQPAAPKKAVRKTAAKKPAAKKTPAKRPAAKKPAAEAKPPAKKPTAKKPAAPKK
jgi:large subunit ribosomal protein L21